MDYNIIPQFHQFIGPCNIAIIGPTLAGKSSLIFKILQMTDVLFSESSIPQEVLYCYGGYQPLYDDMVHTLPNVTFHEGLPSQAEIQRFADGRKPKLLIMDDLAMRVTESVDILTLVTQHMHHKLVSSIIVSQNLYMPGKYARTISLNMQYIVLFRNLRDIAQIGFLGRQLFSGHKRLLEAYRDATEEQNGYLLIDLSPRSDDKFRLRTKILTGVEYCVVYYPR